MWLKDYLDEILNIIAKHPFVVSQSISFEERPPDAAFVTGSITFTPLEKATDSCRWYKSFLGDGGSMPPSLVVREQSSLTGFTNDSKLHFKEFVVFETAGFKILKYGYNYLAQDGAVIFRYDNALDPQAKKLSTYPEHKHTPKKIVVCQKTLF